MAREHDFDRKTQQCKVCGLDLTTHGWALRPCVTKSELTASAAWNRVMGASRDWQQRPWAGNYSDTAVL